MKKPDSAVSSKALQHAEAGFFLSSAQAHNTVLNMPLVEALAAYNQTNRLRFHTPGHHGKLPFSGNIALSSLLGGILPAETFRYDLSEVEGLDVLSAPEGCLREAQRLSAKAFGVAHSYFLVNGASVGLAAGMLSLLKPNDKVLLARNVHRSVISGLILTGAIPVWFLPRQLPEAGIWGDVSPDDIEACINAQPDIRALILTSPTYEGIGSDIEGILRVCKRYGVALMVDEAHGSLWPFSDKLPKSACHVEVSGQTCDLVVHSLHKSAGSLTQSAIAHLPKASAILPERFQEALNTLQTTSPSYLLMASLDAARAFLESPEGRESTNCLLENVQRLRQAFKQSIRQFDIWEPPNQTLYDPSRLWIRHAQCPGNKWAVLIETKSPELLVSVATQHLAPLLHQPISPISYENASPYGALYLCGLGLEADACQRFLETFQAWDASDFNSELPGDEASHPQARLAQAFCLPETVMTPREAFFAESKTVSADQAIGEIAKQTVVHCPPGIAVLMPGERITRAHLPHLPSTLQVVVL